MEAGRKYQQHIERARRRMAALTAAGQEIAPLPAIADLGRRRRTEQSFRAFCEEYFAELFTLAWSADHLTVIGQIQQAVNNCEMYAIAMPRGSGKTTLLTVAVIWAIVTGRHHFVMLLAADEEAAQRILDNIKALLGGNDGLLDDYPEAIYPIRKLEGETRRCNGQRYYGQQTHIGWQDREIILPTLPDSRCSGAVVRVSGVLGNVRGANHMRPDGSSVRPSLVLVDDPQNDASAKSPMQTADRLAVLTGAILGLAGPGKRVAAFVSCTVIRPDDLADQLLDREVHPEWHGQRTQLIYKLPMNEKLWNEYARLRAESMRAGGEGKEANQYYRLNQVEMDRGAKPAWPARFDGEHGEISAVQHAMNLKLRDEDKFWAEYQNQPRAESAGESAAATAEEVVGRSNGLGRGVAPEAAGHLTAFIDVQKDVLWWMVCAFAEDFTGSIVDYGCYPDQKRSHFVLRDVRRTLRMVHKPANLEGAIYAGLEALAGLLLGREWPRANGEMSRVERLFVDAGWGETTDTVRQWCRATPWAALVMPSLGRPIGASATPFHEYRRKPGERLGHHWFVPLPQQKRATRHLLIDVNYWKSFVHTRLKTPVGDGGALTLFEGRGRLTGRAENRGELGGMATDHAMLAEHLTAEYPVATTARGRTVLEWKMRGVGRDNHWLDCLVGCAVGASMQGCSLAGTGAGASGGGGPRKRQAAGEMLKGRKVWKPGKS